nr:hypothetical protein [Nocardiopsis sp. YSL2]
MDGSPVHQGSDTGTTQYGAFSPLTGMTARITREAVDWDTPALAATALVDGRPPSESMLSVMTVMT